MEYQPGEEILEGEEPFSHIIKSQFRSEFCDWCIKKGDPNEEVILKKCTACKEVSYCNRDCQRKAFSAYHKQECSKLKTIPQDIDSTIRDVLIFMKRTIKKVHNGGNLEIAKLPNGAERRYEDLITHQYQNFKGREIIILFHSPWCQNWFGKDVAFEYLMKIFGKITINQHGIFSPSLELIGNGLYIGASVLDHSCDPNAVYVTENGKTISVRAIEKIESFSDVRISYIIGQSQETKEVRMKELKDNYHFDCHCRLCEDEERDSLKSSVMCPKHERADRKNGTNDPYPHCVPIKTGKCIKCGTQVSDDIISKYHSLKASFANDSLKDTNFIINDTNYANWYLEAVNIFHPYDSTYFSFAKKCTTTMKIKDHKGQEQSKAFFQQLNVVMITYIERHFGEFDPLRAEVYFNCGKNFFNERLGNMKLCSKFLVKAMKVLEVSHGLEHPQFDLVRQMFRLCIEDKVVVH